MTELLYGCANSIPLSLAMVLAVHSLRGTEGSLYGIGLFTVALTLICELFYAAKGRLFIILTGIPGAFLCGVYLVTEREQRLAFFLENRWILPAALLSVVCFAFIKVSDRFRPVRYLLAAGTAGFLCFLAIKGMKPYPAAVLCGFAFLLLTVLETVQLSWKKEGDTAVKSHIVGLLPCIFLLFILLSQIRMPETPYRWDFVRKAVKELREGFELLRYNLSGAKEWDEGEAGVGFSESTGFSGRLFRGSHPVLETTRINPSGTRVYLSGKSFDTFDGRQWKKEDESGMDYRRLDLLETLSAVMSDDTRLIYDFAHEEKITIRLSGSKSSHIFSPPKYIDCFAQKSILQAGGDLSFENRKDREYSLSYFRLNRDYEEFVRLLCEEKAFTKKDWEAASDYLLGEAADRPSFEDYREYKKRLRSVYGEETVLNDRTRDLLKELVRGAENDYEKLCRIEAFLSEMSYTKTPGELPDFIDSPGDFLDYLLFDKKSGYCTHFATAFVLLARALGIPARYVQGYSFSAGTSENEIRSDQAHAWPEAYLENVGFIVFEPTPGFKSGEGWQVGNREPQEARDYVREIDGALSIEEEGALEPEQKKELPDPAVIKVPLLLVLLFLLIFIPADLIRKRILYNRMSARDRLKVMWKRNRTCLKHLGLVPKTGETLSEFRIRAKEKVPGELLSFIGIYEEVLYGSRDVTNGDVKAFESAGRSLLSCLLSRLTRFGRE